MKKGFTLIELLIVIAIVAILSAVVVLTLNPAELLRQARDSNRISDMSTIKSALSLYLADAATPVLAEAPAATRCFVSTGATVTANCGGRHGGSTGSTSTTPLAVDGTGWVGNSLAAGVGPNLTLISSGAPLSAWPTDPIANSPTYFYSYAADTTANTFELNADMESTKFSSGSGDVESTDGGNRPLIYETGTASGLTL